MERAAALKKISRILGKSARYRVDASAPTPDQRQQAQSELAAAVIERNNLRDAREARQKAILDADAEYQRLLTEARAASKRVDDLQSLCYHHFKITVGTADRMFFHVKAQGDSWEEVIGKLQEERK